MRTLTLIPILGVAILMASAIAAVATPDIDRECYRRWQDAGFPNEDSKRLCDRSRKVKPHEMGWWCSAEEGVTKMRGGFKLKSEAKELCVSE